MSPPPAKLSTAAGPPSASTAHAQPASTGWSTAGMLAAVVVSVALSHTIPFSALSAATDALLGESALRGRPPSMSPPPRHPTSVEHGANVTMDMVASKQYNTPCVDHSEHCAAWKAKGECISNERFMAITCSHSCGTCASTARAPPLPPVPEQVASHGNLLDEPDGCKDEHGDCAIWAQQGECSKNAAYMHGSCPVSCRTCSALKQACERVEGSAAISQQPGGLDALFERALSAPEFARFSPKVLHREPWVVEFENFISDDEAAAIITLANSSLVRSLAGDAVSPVRTSNQYWCSSQHCLSNPHVRAVEERVAAVTTVPTNNMEYFQVLRYEPGQFYRSHHDQVSRLPHPRPPHAAPRWRCPS